MVAAPHKLNLDRVAFYGRTLDEYRALFDFDPDDYKGKAILDCPAGASSFTAEAIHHGVEAIACDPLFGETVERLAKIGVEDIAHVLERLEPVKHLYKWDFYKSPLELKKYREKALRLFLEDYPCGVEEGHYRRCALPNLVFPGRMFDMVLCGHFIFTYHDMFDYQFVHKSILEMCRVSRGEVRIYPLQGNDSRPYPEMDRLIADLEKSGVGVEIRKVPFEFQVGSDKTMILTI